MANLNTQVNLGAFSGNTIVATFGGVAFGAFQSIQFSDDHGVDPVAGIGDNEVIENVPGLSRYTVSAEKVVFRRDAMVASGLIPPNSAGMLQGLVFDLLQYDKVGGNVILKLSGVSYASGSLSVTANRIVSQSLQFNAIHMERAY